MKRYAEARIPKDDRFAFRLIDDAIKHLRSSIPVDQLSCHVLARAAARVFYACQLTVVDGRFCVAWEHSWLKTPHGNIIDVYPIAAFGHALLLDGSYTSPWGELYTAFPSGYYKDKASPEHVKTLIAELSAITGVIKS